jgi:DNA anti-recombination protein RmuC
VFGFKTLRLSRAVSDLDERLSKLERAQKAVEMEWDQAWEKLKRMMGRISKRSELAERESDSTPAPTMRDDANGTQAPTGRLSDRQREIQQHILRRRAGG